MDPIIVVCEFKLELVENAADAYHAAIAEGSGPAIAAASTLIQSCRVESEEGDGGVPDTVPLRAGLLSDETTLQAVLEAAGVVQDPDHLRAIGILTAAGVEQGSDAARALLKAAELERFFVANEDDEPEPAKPPAKPPGKPASPPPASPPPSGGS